MRVWRYQGVHRLTWVVLVLLVLALAVFAMAAGFSRLRSEAVSAGSGGDALEVGALQREFASTGACPPDLHQAVLSGCESRLLSP